MSKYNTNLASEFHVLSMLYRLGIDASLTLGNKKSVDIFVFKETGQVITIDVKGVMKKWREISPGMVINITIINKPESR